ncbi:MAG TPA: response regulator transcription factor, partial [Terriglobales bacterium]|nr:response regulator transcription factor [Terriglobales bacterium]
AFDDSHSVALKIVNVLLVDSHALVRRGVRRMLEDDHDIRIVGESGNGAEAIRLARALQPRVALMDCSWRGIDGLDTVRAIVKSSPQTAVVILGIHSGKAWMQNALASGAHGFISKSATEVELLSLIKRVAEGERESGPLEKAKKTSSRRMKELSSRQLQILRMIVEGNSTKQIANQLGLSANTVSVHRARISRSLGLRNTAGLVAYAIRNGLADLSSSE